MEWMPKHLMSEFMKEAASWAQHVKQFIILISGIETKRQDQMNKSERCDFVLAEFEKWTDFLGQKYPDAAVLPFLSYTTGNKTTRVDGKHLYRNFSEGLRVFHNDLNPLWKKVVGGQTSGKSVEELWCFWCYLYWCRSRKPQLDPEDWTPKGFDVSKVEKMKWVMAFKFLGPPCEKFHHGSEKCHEFLASPAGLVARGTTAKKRKTERLSRQAFRDSKTKRTKEAVAAAYAQKHEVCLPFVCFACFACSLHASTLVAHTQVSVSTLGRMQTVHNNIRLQQKHMTMRFDRMMELFKVTTDPAMRTRLQERMDKLLTADAPSFAETERKLFGPVVDLTGDDDADPVTPARKAIDLDSSDSGDDSSSSSVFEPSKSVSEAGRIVDDVLSQSGYVILKSVVPKPARDGWFAKFKQDLERLKGRKNFVEIFNDKFGKQSDHKRHMVVFNDTGVKEFGGSATRPASTPDVLARVRSFVRPWFCHLLNKIKSLQLLQFPRVNADPVLLVSEPGCAEQKMHWDFDPKIVRSLVESKNFAGVPVSVWCSFTPTGSDLVVSVRGKVKNVHVDFGDCVVFTGDLVHAGSASKDYNVRGFFHVNHPEDCPYNQKQVWLQLAKENPQPPKAQPQVPQESSTNKHKNKTLGAKRRSGRNGKAPNRLLEAMS